MGRYNVQSAEIMKVLHRACTRSTQTIYHGTEAMSGSLVLNLLSDRGLEMEQEAMEVPKIEFRDHPLSSNY
jgi:hypothetical protein